MTRLGTLLTAAFVLASAGATNAEPTATPPADGKPAAWSGVKDSVELSEGKIEYVFGLGDVFKAFKPYITRIRSPKGVNPLRDNVPDHIHHHGLMFAVAVDGVDFWSEAKNCGRQIPLDITPESARVRGGEFVPTIKGRIDWTKYDYKTVIAKEEREIESIPASLRHDPNAPTLISWHTRLSPSAGAESIKLTGSHYFGLGMRFVKSMDNASTFMFADPSATGLTVRGDEKLTPSAWAACTGAVDGNTVTVAMFDHPDNPRPVLWFTMGKPFSYLSATTNLWKEPMVVKAGQELDVCYGVAVWDGKATREQIDAACRQWRKLAPSLKADKKGKPKD